MRSFVSALLLLQLLACTQPVREHASTEVLFICEHGNVKSLMAASYFNALAKERGLPYRGISRGVAPDATSAPAPIAAALGAEGFDVRDFKPAAVDQADVRRARRIVAISTQAPSSLDTSHVPLEQWDDVPPASIDYPAARDALRAHVTQLLDELAKQQ